MFQSTIEKEFANYLIEPVVILKTQTAFSVCFFIFLSIMSILH